MVILVKFRKSYLNGINTSFLYWLFIPLLFQSCASVSYYSRQDAVMPAKIPIPSHIQSIKIVNRSVNKSILNRAVNTLKTGNIVGDQYTAGRNVLMSGVESGLLHVSSVSRKMDRADHTETPADPMALARIKEYAGQADALLGLEQFTYGEQREYKRYQKHQLDENGADQYINVVRGTRTTTLITYWRLYDTHTGKILQTIPQKTVDFLDVEGLDERSANVKMDTTRIMRPDILASVLAQELVDDLKPHYNHSNWMYYKKGNDAIKRSANFIKKGRFRESISLLEKSIPNIEKRDSKEKAIYNLAVSCFLSGDKKQAILWAKEEMEVSNKKEFVRMLNQINRYK